MAVDPTPAPLAAAARDRLRIPARAARQQSLRSHNLGLVFREVLEAPSPVSRADVAALTGLTRATVSALVEQLVAARLVGELTPVAGQRAGRPAVPLVPARGTVAAVGMEVNVDYLGVCAVDMAGETLVEHIVRDDFRHSDPEPVLDRLAGLAAGVVDELQARGVAIVGTALAIPGLVDSVTGPLRLAPNLGWRDLDVLAVVARHPVLAAVPPRLGNDAKLAAIAESRARRRTGPSSFVYVSGEVGIGGAIVLDGAIFRGVHGWSGEIGHVAVGTDGPPDVGGTLESYAGQDALMDAAGLPRTAPISELLAGGQTADRAMDAAAGALGVVLSSVVNIVDVDHVVLGGIYAELADRLGPAVEAQLRDRVIAASWTEVAVEAAIAGRYPAMTGGALSVLEAIAEDPAEWIGSEEDTALAQ
ncbi:ROK family protein [Isoptericola sp. b441]|uniref:ROK family protein n=1 Tax=Actinotalea lenta TaxID=3064654 RepID=A0ABT9D901_9CELL|nr:MULTISPECIES: ROK family protein [unclassified Isoptericola]MDO8106613.1 ROK family protein [Isoptericola sp. b441]MDO8121679.1 ROK family protein [Isoptericola sp. b490]